MSGSQRRRYHPLVVRYDCHGRVLVQASERDLDQFLDRCRALGLTVRLDRRGACG